MPTSERQVRVSYIISTKNRANILVETFKNVREFITPADELIIIDGASTDNTAEIVKANRDIVTLFVSEPDKGEAHGLNKGILVSRGRFIKILTDDDYFYPDAMRQVTGVLEAHPEIDALQCGGECFSVDAETHEEQLLCYEFLPTDCQLTSDVSNIFDYVPCGLGLVLTRRIVARVGLFDTTWRAVDTDYMSRLIALRVNFQYAHVKLYRHRAYAHSGQQDVAAMSRDRTRALLRNLAWDEVRRFPKSSRGEAIGVKTTLRDKLMLNVIWSTVQYRQSRMPYLRILSAVTHAIDFGHHCIRRAKQLFRKEAAEHTLSLNGMSTEEPRWDGSLR